MNFIKFYKAHVIHMGFFLLTLNLSAQDQNLADSLINVLQTDTISQESRYEILRNIAFNHSVSNEKLKYAKRLLELAVKDSSEIWKYRGYLQMGNAYNRMGEFDSALNCYFKMATAATNAQYQAGIGTAFFTIGDSYNNNDDQVNAFKYYNQAISILKETNDSNTLAAALLNTGYAYYSYEKYDSSLIYYSQALNIYEKINFPIGIGYALGNTGLTFAAQGDFLRSTKEIQKAIETLTEFGDFYAITEFQLELSKILANNGLNSEAIKYGEQSYKISKRDGLKKRIRDASLKLSELYQATGEYQKAYTYQSQYIAYRDSINNEETIRKMADLRTEYEVGQKQAEVDLANAEKEAQAKQALLVGAGLVIFLLLIGIIALIQYRNNQTKKATNQILRQQKSELESLNTTKDRFFSIISHDLRGPVNAFFGVSKLIKMYVSKGKVNEITEIAEDIDESVSKLSGLLDNLLDWAVQQQGQFPNVPEKINCNDMTMDLIQVFDTMAKSKNIELISDLPGNVELFVDKNSTMTIFRNLINNALKFTEEGGSVTVHGELQKEMAILKVTDTGVGIPAEKLKKLFTLNEKKSTWGTGGEKGLGLGLQLAYEFAEMNKGSIEVESEEGVGTSFIVKLPVFETEDVKSGA